MSANFINTAEQVRELVTKIEQWLPKDPFLFLDLEGVNLSRQGSISILQLLIGPERTVYLLDIHNLREDAFLTPSEQGLTLRDILESEHYPKIFYDVRMDSDALYAHYQIRLHCVIDLQLLEFVTRPIRGKYLSGLAKCIERDAGLSYGEVREWTAVKEAGRRHFVPEAGGEYEVFNERPLNAALTRYCIQDVQFMPRLLMRYAERLSDSEALQVQDQTVARIRQSQGPVPLRKGRNMAIGPTLHPIYHASRSVKLKYPFNIICSAVIKLYCDPQASNRTHVAPTATMTTSDTIETTISPGTTRTQLKLSNINASDKINIVTTTEPAQAKRLSLSFTVHHNQEKMSKTVKSKEKHRISHTKPHDVSAFSSSPDTVGQQEHINVSEMAPTVSKALQQLSNVKTPDFTLSPQPTIFADDDSCEDSETDVGQVDEYLNTLRLSSTRFNRPATVAHYISDFDDNDGGTGQDYAACSAEGCGYCGHCTH